MNDLICMDTSPRIDLTTQESIDMLNSAIGTFSNFVVSASSLAQEVASLREEIAVLRAQFGDAALRLEQADAAYRTVNSQRIEAENEVTSLRNENVALRKDYDINVVALTQANDEVVLWKEECARLVKDSDATIASANEKARAANERAYAAEAEVAQLKLSLEDHKTSLSSAIKARDEWMDRSFKEQNLNNALRSMISDASLVLSGTHAVE
jgi:chromosome segregation ATPase